MKELKKIKSPAIREIRGRGLIIGMEINGEAGLIVEKALSAGLIINNPKPNVIRLVPPLIINKKQIDKGVKILKEILK